MVSTAEAVVGLGRLVRRGRGLVCFPGVPSSGARVSVQAPDCVPCGSRCKSLGRRVALAKGITNVSLILISFGGFT